MKQLLAVVLFAFTPCAASASIPLVPGARWQVSATSAARFARDSSALLNTMSQDSISLSVKHAGQMFRRSYSLPLVDPDALKAAGVDISLPWIAFERSGARYLWCGVSDSHALTASLDGWANGRATLHREETTVPALNATAVTFSHSMGSHPAAGYLIAKGRALVLIKAAERTPALAVTFAAVEAAAPVQPPVDGSLLVWAGQTIRADAARDVWLAFTARADGIDLTGSARKVEAGWFVRDPKKADWIRSITTGATEAVGEPLLWAIVNAGPKSAENLVDSFIEAGSGPLSSWASTLGTLGPGIIEAAARTFDIDAMSAGSVANIRATLLLATQPEVVIEDRTPALVAAHVEDLGKRCGATPENGLLHAKCSDGAVTAYAHDRNLGIGIGTNGPPPREPIVTYTTKPIPVPALTCAKGIPVASARMNMRTISDRTKDIGFMDALTSDAMAGMYAISLEYGGLLRALQPAVGLMCLDAAGRMTIQGRWRIAIKK